MKKRLLSILLTACLALSLCTGLSGTLLAKAADESSIKINDLVQVKVGDSLTDLKVYRNGVYEAMVPVEAGDHTATVFINGAATDMTTTFTADAAGEVCLRVKDNALTQVAIQSCALVGSFTGLNFVDEAGEPFFIENWNPEDSNAELTYLGGGLYGRTFRFNQLEEDLPIDEFCYKVAFNDRWDYSIGDGSDNIALTIPAGSSSLTVLVDEINQVVYDSVRSGSFSVAQDSGDIALPALATTVSLIGTVRYSGGEDWVVDAKGYEFDLISDTLYRYEKTLEAGAYNYKCVFDYESWYAQDCSFTLTEKSRVVFLYDTVTDRLYDTVNDYSEVAKLIGMQAKVSAMYLDENGDDQTAVCTLITADNISSYGTLNAGWYVVEGEVEASSRVTVSGDVHLILTDGCTLTVNGGIQVQDDDADITNGSANALTIYGQTQPVLDANGNVTNNVGKLTANAFASGNAGIGGNFQCSGGTITINGGTVIATSTSGAGIGGGCVGDGSGGSGDKITINGGTVIATSTSGAGIGGGGGTDGGEGGSGGEITINGGTVTATTTDGGAGIGGGGGIGSGGSGGEITITGGTVTATGGNGAGIGGGHGNSSSGSNDTFKTNNGNAVIFASSIGDKSNQDSWSGIIFEGDADGKVYGTAVTPIEDFTIDSGKTLLIPEGKTLTIADITATNSGSIYVDGSLSGMVGGNGSVYYPLTVKGGTASGDVSTYQLKNYGKAGSEITLTPDTPPTGYAFSAWEVSSADAVTVADDTFTMPGAAVEVEAKWTKNSSGGSSTPTYPPTVTQPENGSVTVSPKSPRKGDTVTITTTPVKGYTVEQILVTDKNGAPVEVTNNGDGTYSFTQPAGKVDINVTFMEDNTMLNFFVDVPADAYYYDAVLWAVENGITDGTSDTAFSPNAPCTRAQIVTFLWRAAGCPEPESLISLSDVPADAYYAKAVAWALENGITTGSGNGTFRPNATCTRAQAMTFIYRSEQAQGGGMEGDWMFQNPFSDVDLENYYGEAVMWAVANGVTTGTSDTAFSPSADCTRAQIVTFLFRYLVE